MEKTIRKILEKYRTEEYNEYGSGDTTYNVILEDDFDKLEKELFEYMDNKVAEVVWEYEVDEGEIG